MRKTPKILVLAAGSLGDSLLTLPALKVLTARGEITLPGTSPYTALGADLFGVQKTLSLEPLLQSLFSGGDQAQSQNEFWEAFRDVFLLFKGPDERLSANLAAFSHLRVHQPVERFEDFLGEDRWAGEYWLEAVEPFFGTSSFPSHPMRLAISPEVKRDGLEICGSLGLNAPFVIHPGSGSPSKNAPLSFFRDAAEKIRNETGKSVLVTWGEAEEKILGEIREAFSGLSNVRMLSKPFALKDLAALLTTACGFLGNDSGVTQLASACGARVFVVFRGTNSKVWAPPGAVILETGMNFTYKDIPTSPRGGRVK